MTVRNCKREQHPVAAFTSSEPRAMNNFPTPSIQSSQAKLGSQSSGHEETLRRIGMKNWRGSLICQLNREMRGTGLRLIRVEPRKPLQLESLAYEPPPGWIITPGVPAHATVLVYSPAEN